MRLLGDENIESEIILALRNAGFEVSSIRETNPGIEDKTVLSIAKRDKAVLLTNDKDFGELIYRDRLASNGVLLLRFENLSMQDRIERLEAVLAKHGDDIEDSFTVITDHGARIRTKYLV